MAPYILTKKLKFECIKVPQSDRPRRGLQGAAPPGPVHCRGRVPRCHAGEGQLLAPLHCLGGRGVEPDLGQKQRGRITIKKKYNKCLKFFLSNQKKKQSDKIRQRQRIYCNTKKL